MLLYFPCSLFTLAPLSCDVNCLQLKVMYGLATFCDRINTKGVQRYWYIDPNFPLEAHIFLRQLQFWLSIRSFHTSFDISAQAEDDKRFLEVYIFVDGKEGFFSALCTKCIKWTRNWQGLHTGFFLHGERQLCRIESLHPSRHAVTAAVFRRGI